MTDYDNMDFEEVEIPEDIDPEDVGPAVTGKKPLIGEFRRKNGIPVVRDELGKKVRGGI